MVKRWVITYYDGSMECRALFDPMQGRYTYSTKDEAQKRLDAFLAKGDLSRVLSPSQIASLDVREWDCYDEHFDPIGRYQK